MASINGSPLLIRKYLEHQKKKRLVLAVDWERETRQLKYDTWSIDEPKRRLFTSMIRLDVPLRSSEMRATSEHGLSCVEFQDGSTFFFNPVYRQLSSLPRLEKKLSDERTCFLGFQPNTVDYKVLAVTKDAIHNSAEFHLLSMRGRTWKRLQCQLEFHYPVKKSTSVCIEGVLYYGGYTKEGPSLMKFDMNTEIFNLIQVPVELKRMSFFLWDTATLTTFRGKPTIGKRLIWAANSLTLFVLETTTAWTEHIIQIPPLREGIEYPIVVYFEGATPCGNELIFIMQELSYIGKSRELIVYYNPGTRTTRRFPIKGILTPHSVTVWNHTESLIDLKES